MVTLRIQDSNPEAHAKLMQLKSSWAESRPIRNVRATAPVRKPTKKPQPATYSRPGGRRRVSAKEDPKKYRIAHAKLGPAQKEFATQVTKRVRPRLGKIDPVLIEKAIVRTLVKSESLLEGTQRFFDAVEKDLESRLGPTLASTARRRVEQVHREWTATKTPQASTPGTQQRTATSAPAIHLPPSRRGTANEHSTSVEILSALQATDASIDFATVLDALEDLFRKLATIRQERASAVFLQAIDNRFALVVPDDTRTHALHNSPLSARWDDLTALPTTRGLALFRNKPEIFAWDMSLNHCFIAKTTVSDLEGFLITGSLPQLEMEDVSPRDLNAGVLVRFLAGLARGLSDPAVKNFPLSADRARNTSRLWNDKHLKRMKRPESHRVREHLRRLPSGDITSVRAHSRYGDQDWLDGHIRVQVLPRRRQAPE